MNCIVPWRENNDCGWADIIWWRHFFSSCSFEKGFIFPKLTSYVSAIVDSRSTVMKAVFGSAIFSTGKSLLNLKTFGDKRVFIKVS
jgi:hypothetical protein